MGGLCQGRSERAGRVVFLRLQLFGYNCSVRQQRAAGGRGPGLAAPGRRGREKKKAEAGRGAGRGAGSAEEQHSSSDLWVRRGTLGCSRSAGNKSGQE